MSGSVLRSLLCLLALCGVTALQVRPDSSRVAPRPVLRATTLVAAAAAAAEDEGKAGLSASTANLVKSIVGSGVLSLPVGVAAFSSARTAILPALTLLAVAGAISGYCAPHRHTYRMHTCAPASTLHRLHFLDSVGFSAVGRVCAATGSKSWGEAWSKSVGDQPPPSTTSSHYPPLTWHHPPTTTHCPRPTAHHPPPALPGGRELGGGALTLTLTLILTLTLS
jgi:sodium-coupled neutral amino acid transporter 11